MVMPDLPAIFSLDADRQAQWHNDLPEACSIVLATAILALIDRQYGQGFALCVGFAYAAIFLATNAARSPGLLLSSDLTRKPGNLVNNLSQLTINRTYYWWHHFDRGESYYFRIFTLTDKIMATSLWLKDKVVAVTGASGSLGRSLLAALAAKGAHVVALTTSPQNFADASDLDSGAKIEAIPWQLGAEAELRDRLRNVDILIINHGVNVYGDRDVSSVERSFEVNTFSAWRLMNLFLDTVVESSHKATKELWINTSEAEVNPAFSPLYELSKRALGNLITLSRLDAPCIIRKLILGPFKSKLNPIGVMSADWVASAIVALAQRDVRDIIVTVNPFTYIFFPIHEFLQSAYFRLFSKRKSKSDLTGNPT
jgi:monoglucosyldiacylglycerol epimerase